MAEDAVAAKRRRRCTGGGGGYMAALPEHVLLEILSRVGTVKDLFMFAVTCRRWIGRFTDRTFLGELLCPGQGQVQGLLGFFLQDAMPGVTLGTTRADAARQLASACSFLPAPGSPIGPGPTARALTSSLVADGDGAFDHAVPLAARRGIVLMQRVPRRRDRHLLLGICNPVTGERHLLAPLRGNPQSICGYAIITAADAHANDAAAHAGRFTFSQLLVAILDLTSANWAVRLHSYSAATRSWSAPTECLVNARCFSLVSQTSAVVHQGAAHWLWLYDTDGVYVFDDTGRRRALPAAAARDNGSVYKLSVQLGAAAAGRTSFAFTRIPVRVGGDSFLCVTGDGKLAVVCVYFLHVSVSTCQQQQAGGHAEAEAWERTAAFRIPAAAPTPTLWQPKEMWFRLSRGPMLVLYRRSSRAVFIVDIHRKTMEKLMDCFLPLFADKMTRTAVPYEMDLVDFFMLKLDGLIDNKQQVRPQLANLCSTNRM